MSGLTGIYAGSGAVAPVDVLLAMAGELRHRGPAGVGLYLDRGVGMACASSSTPGLPGGAVPASDGTGRYWVVHDGEIYNRAELLDALRRRGHELDAPSTGELMARGYAAWGPAFLNRLNGEFALALWDREKAELFLARDRFGIRPLFVAERGGVVCFASEAKALFRHPLIVPEIDAAGLAEAFVLWSSLPGRSVFAGVDELPGGHWLRVGPGGVRLRYRWWDSPFIGASAEGVAPRREVGEWAEELTALLADAVRIRWRSDLPIGVYLSGGLDSSAIAALVRRDSSGPVQAFSLGFTDEEYDETPYQDRVAEGLELRSSRVVVSGPEIAALLPRVVELTEKPTLRTAPVPLFRLSSAVRDAGYRIVLTGEGADEIFAGYDVFKLDKVRRFWARQPDSRLRPLLFPRLFGYLQHDLHRAGALLAEGFRGGLTETSDPLYSHRPRFEKGLRLLRLFNPDLLARALEDGGPVERLQALLPEALVRSSGLKRAQYLETITFLSGYLLHSQGDRVLMGNSVEGRFPFLDHRLAEFAARLPDRLLIRGLREKYLLRRTVQGLVPEEIVHREKRPYRAPILSALVGPDAPDYVGELTMPEKIAEAGIFDPGAVDKLFRKCRARVGGVVGEVDEMALIGVLSTMLLHERWIARPRVEDPAIATRLVIGSKDVEPSSLYREPIHDESTSATPV